MGLETKKLMTSKFEDRAEPMDIPADILKAAGWKKGTKWMVRALSGEELYAVRGAVDKNKNLEELMKRLISGEIRDKVEAALETLGFGDQLPDDYVRRLNILKLGSVDPECDLELAKFVAMNAATFFNCLTDKIQALTGQGRSLGESKPSGQTRK